MLIIQKFLIRNKLLKIYLDIEMVLYEISFDNINTNFVYNKDDFHNDKIEGIPTYLKLQKANYKDFEYIPNEPNYIFNRTKHFILTYRYLNTYSNKSVATVNRLQLCNIKKIK